MSPPSPNCRFREAVLAAPEWLEERMRSLRRQARPTDEEVRTEWPASARYIKQQQTESAGQEARG